MAPPSSAVSTITATISSRGGSDAASGSARRRSSSTPPSLPGTTRSDRSGGDASVARLGLGVSSRRSRIRILLEDRPLESLELLARLQSKLLRELAAGLAVGDERLGLPSGSVERKHQLAAQPLPQGLLGYEGLELADQLAVAATSQIGLDPLLERDPAQLIETGDFGLSEGLVGEVGKRRTPPKRESPAQLLGRPLWIFPSRLVEELLKAGEIELRGLDTQDVPGGLGNESALTELLPEL